MIIRNRYAQVNSTGMPLLETTFWLTAAEAGLPEDSPKLRNLSGETEKFYFYAAQDYFGDLSLLSAYQNPTTGQYTFPDNSPYWSADILPILPDLTIITQAQYDQLVIDTSYTPPPPDSGEL